MSAPVQQKNIINDAAASDNEQNAPGPVKIKKTTSLRKKVAPADFNGPQRPPTSFMLFSHERRDEVRDGLRAALKPGEALRIASVACKMGELWKALPDAEKAPYLQAAEEAKKEYELNLQKWKFTEDYREFVKASALHNKKKADKKALDKAKADGMPIRPQTGYMRFSMKIQETVRAELEAKGQKFSIMAAAPLVKAKWTALAEAGQQPYNDEYTEAKTQYDADLQTWQESEAGKTLAKSKKAAVKRKAEQSKVEKAPKKPRKAAGGKGAAAKGAAAADAAGADAAAPEEAVAEEAKEPAVQENVAAQQLDQAVAEE